MVPGECWQGSLFYSRRFNLNLQKFVDGFTEEEIKEVIENDEELEKTGRIGDCALRAKTEEFMELNHIDDKYNKIIFMGMVAKQALKKKYHQNNSKEAHESKEANEQIALIEFNNSAPQITRYKSKNVITLDRIVKSIEKSEPSVNWERDSVTLLDEIYEEDLDH